MQYNFAVNKIIGEQAMSEFNFTPEWVKNAIFYQIFPDRFAHSKNVIQPDNMETWDLPPTIHGFKGGDLLGVYEKLDYLQDLGINAIYFNPIFQSASNHRYHTHDYYQVDPLLGGRQAFDTLITEAHRRNIRIVLDGVFNHASRGFFQFNHILECGEKSPYLHWFEVRGFPLHAYEGHPNYRCWWNFPALPEFNTDHPQVRKYIFDVARYWVEQGIDGWRLDVPFDIDDDEFWREFRMVVKSANPDAYIVGEIPSEAQRWMKGDMFDAVMNYQFTLACLTFFGGVDADFKLSEGMMGFHNFPVLDAEHFLERTNELLHLYPYDFSLAQLNLLDSHDMPRFLSLVRGDTATFKLATLFQMTYPGAPCVYYGDEIGLTGGKDPGCRKSFPWEEEKWDGALRSDVKNLISIRNQHPALRTGDFIPLYGGNQVIVYCRKDQTETIVVIINNNTSNITLDIDMKRNVPTNINLKDLLTGKDLVVENGWLHKVDIPAKSGIILI